MALLLGFDLALELVEAVAPEVVEERAQLDQPLGTDAVDTSSTVTTLAQQPSAVQDAQVLRHRLPGDVEVRGDLPRGHLLAAHQPQDLPSSRLDYGLYGCLHDRARVSALQGCPCASFYLRRRKLTLAQVFAYIFVVQRREEGRDEIASSDQGIYGCDRRRRPGRHGRRTGGRRIESAVRWADPDSGPRALSGQSWRRDDRRRHAVGRYVGHPPPCVRPPRRPGPV